MASSVQQQCDLWHNLYVWPMTFSSLLKNSLHIAIGKGTTFPRADKPRKIRFVLAPDVHFFPLQRLFLRPIREHRNPISAERRQPSRWWAAVVPALLLFAITLCTASDPATITFSLDFPNSSPEHYSIAVQSDGHAHYESSGKITADSDVRDDYQTDFTFSDSSRARIFDLAAQAHYFSGKVDSGNKKLAFTGSKKLVYKDSQRTQSADYNFPQHPAVQQLTVLFQSVAATMEFGRRLTYFHRYQKLALDDELKQMEDQAKRGELAELQAVSPVLQEIYEDASVINVIRARARRIIEMKSLPPGK